MIVKNEEKWIEGCLRSVKSIADDIIIVDTGCTDSTMELARPFQPTVIRHPWQNDFADARNVALNAARTPWILVLDPDERIAGRDLPAIVEATHTDYPGIELLWRNYGYNPARTGWTINTGAYKEGEGFPGYVQDPMLRMFRNEPLLRYHGAVHEYIDRENYPGWRFKIVPAVIHHYGRALSAERAAEKSQFYLDLGYQKIRNEPHRWQAFYELGIQLQEFGRHADALPYLERGWELCPDPHLLFPLAVAYKHLGQPEKAVAILERAIATGHDCFGVRLTLGNLCLAARDLTQAAKHYEHAQRFDAQDSVLLLNQGLLLREKGDMAGAEAKYSESLQRNPSYVLPAIELAALRAGQQRLPEAANLLENVLQHDPGCRNAVQGLARIYVQMKRPDDALRVLGDTRDDPALEVIRGAAHLDKGDLETSRDIFESVLKRDRTLVDARVNLANVYAAMGEFSKAARHVRAAYGLVKHPPLKEMLDNFERQAV